MAGYYQIIESANGTANFHLRAGNHEVILAGTVHHSREEVLRTIEWIRAHAHDRSRYEPRRTVGGGRYFVLLDESGRVMGKSEVYARSSGVETGIASVQRNGATSQFRGLVQRFAIAA